MPAKQVFTGTVVVMDTASGTSSTNDPIGKSTTIRSLNNTVVLTVTKGEVVARIAYEEKSRVDSESHYQFHKAPWFGGFPESPLDARAPLQQMLI